jgi:uncharacterized protein YjbI with pentapeptide repeats
MASRITKAEAAWRDKVDQIRESDPDQNRYRFHNFLGDVLTKNQLMKLLTSSAAAWNNFKRKQKHSIIWYETNSRSFWLPGYIIDLRNTDLRNTDLTDRDLSNIDFSGSNLSGVNFSRSTFDLSDITGTIAGHTTLSGCNLRRSKWAPTRLHYVSAHNADFSHAELNGATFSHCQLQNAKFSKALIAAAFDSSDIRGADFEASHIFASSFFNVDLSSARNMHLASYHADSRIDYQTIRKRPCAVASGVRSSALPHPLHRRYIEKLCQTSELLHQLFGKRRPIYPALQKRTH